MTRLDNTMRRSDYHIPKEAFMTQKPGEAMQFAFEIDHKLFCHLLPAGICD